MRPLIQQQQPIVPQNLKTPTLLDQKLGISYNSAGSVVQAESEYIIDQEEELEDEEAYSITLRISSQNGEMIDSIAGTSNSFTYSLLSHKPATITVHSIYNYEYFAYENLTKNLDPLVLPNYNLFRNNNNLDQKIIKTYNGKYDLHDVNTLSLVKDIEDNTITQYYNYFDKANQKLGNEVKDYDDNYYKFFTDTEINNPPLPTDFHLKTKHVFLEEAKSNNTGYVPFYNLIKLNKFPKAEQDYGFLDSIEDFGLHMDLLTYIKRNQFTTERHTRSGRSVSIKKWDFNLESLLDNREEQQDEIFVKKKYQDLSLSSNILQTNTIKLKEYFDNRLKRYILYKKLEKLSKDKVLTFSDMIENKVAIHKDFIGYKIEKKLQLGGTSIQTYYILERNAELVDSQIQYDRTYYYKISEIYLTYENEYSYLAGEKQFLTSLGTKLLFVSNVQPKIIEIPTGVMEKRVLAQPLFKPDVKAYANTQVDHKVKFFVSDRFGNSTTQEETYTVLNDSDREYRERLKLSGLVDSSNKAYFSYRTRTGTYRVYKLETKPKEYEDFSNAFLGVIGNTTNLDGIPSAIFTDHIRYEQKYYYLFVAISRQGQGGNPSYVQEVQLLKDADENILRYNAYELEEPKEQYSNESTFRRFIQIVPNYNQTIPKQDFDIGEVKQREEDPKLLGPDEDNLWDLKGNKYIKLRVESKSTGKKFDLNLRFKLKK